MDRVSVIIAARNEKYLQPTIDSCFDRALGDVEVVAVMDGYLPEIRQREGLILLHNEKPIGQRAAYNQGVRHCSGNFVMKLDGHALPSEGYDIALMEACEARMTIIPRMLRLDVEKWEPKQGGATNFMYFAPDGYCHYWNAFEKRNGNGGPIADVMVGNGSAWFRTRAWDEYLGGLDEGVGFWGLVGIENALKTWLMGGRQVVHKTVWQAHWFRNGSGFPYPMTGRAVGHAHKWAIDKWFYRDDAFGDQQVKPFRFIIDKFAPVPQWDVYALELKYGQQRNEFGAMWHKHWADTGWTSWAGFEIRKYPNDLIALQQIIFEVKPDILIETGTWKGGSALFFSQIMDMVGNGKVISIDPRNQKWRSRLPKHERIEYVTGSSIDEAILRRLRKEAKNKRVLVVLDSRHEDWHVKKEIMAYRHLVSVGSYMVVEDTCLGWFVKPNWGANARCSGPKQAVDWYLRQYYDYERVPVGDRFLLTCAPGGWLKRVK